MTPSHRISLFSETHVGSGDRAVSSADTPDMLANIYDDSADDLNALEMTLKLPADAPDMLANIYDDSADELKALEMTLKLPADAPVSLAEAHDDSADELKALEMTLKCWRTHPFRWRRHTMTLRTS